MLIRTVWLAVAVAMVSPAFAGPMTPGERQRSRRSLRDFRGRSYMGASQDLYQWFLMISTHAQRHILQIREVKAHAAYPKK